MIGNDVVDLARPEARDKADDRPFLHRVLTPREQRAVWRAGSPDLVLWMLWSAKEAAFKALRRAHPDLVFSPRRFEVEIGDVRKVAADGRVAVREPAGGRSLPRLRVSWHWNRVWLHCLAETALPPRGDAVWRVAPVEAPPGSGGTYESARETHSRQSSAVRDLAARLLGEAGFRCTAIERPRIGNRPGPPVARLAPPRTIHSGLSLSHDGEWAAAAVLVPELETGERSATR